MVACCCHLLYCSIYFNALHCMYCFAKNMFRYSKTAFSLTKWNVKCVENDETLPQVDESFPPFPNNPTYHTSNLSPRLSIVAQSILPMALVHSSNWQHDVLVSRPPPTASPWSLVTVNSPGAIRDTKLAAPRRTNGWNHWPGWKWTLREELIGQSFLVVRDNVRGPRWLYVLSPLDQIQLNW